MPQKCVNIPESVYNDLKDVCEFYEQNFIGKLGMGDAIKRAIPLLRTSIVEDVKKLAAGVKP